MRIILALLLMCGTAYANLTNNTDMANPPTMQDVSTIQNQYAKTQYDNHNLLQTVEQNPNGLRMGRYGDMVRYYDGTTWAIYTCISSPQGKMWRNSSADCRGIPAGGTASQALVKLSGTDYDVGWQDVCTGFLSGQSIFNNFTGDGSAGAITISADTNVSDIDSPQYVIQATDFTVDAGKTLTVNEGFVFIGATGTCTIHGTINADGQGALGATGNVAPPKSGQNAWNYSGLTASGTEHELSYIIMPGTLCLGGAASGGQNGGTTSAGGGAGGIGGVAASATVTPTQKTAIIESLIQHGSSVLAILMSSRGAGGGQAPNPNWDAGGNGGGVIYIECNEFIFDGTLTADGANGAVTGQYGGGGGGGTIIVRCRTLTTNTGSMTVTGGNQGAGVFVGADGYRKISNLN